MPVEFSPIPGANYRYDYPQIFADIAAGKLKRRDTYRDLAKKDIFFLLYFGLERVDINHPWLVDRCRDVDELSSNTLDLWAREHYKSTILTYAKPLQELINNPEERIAFFSHTRPIAKGFLRQIKVTLEGDCPLKRWFPDIFWDKPKAQAPKWSEDDGLVVKRKSNAKESSIEAWGMVDGQPTSKHFTIRVYDDTVTKEGVTNVDMIMKTKDAYELSHSLGTDGGKKRVVGTHYSFADLYVDLKKIPEYVVRVHPATDNGKAAGNPVFLSPERLQELRVDQGIYVFSCQQLLDPVSEENQTFKKKWLQTWPATHFNHLNIYILVDPANEKKEQSDYTSIMVVGIGEDRNYYVIDMIRDKLNLTERTIRVMAMHREYRPLKVGYERYGKDSDVQHIKYVQKEQNYRFHIHELGGPMPKPDRIRKLIPLFESRRVFLPDRCIKTNYENVTEDLTQVFINEEYLAFPYVLHDDMLDCLARIEDPKMKMKSPNPKRPETVSVPLLVAAQQRRRAKADYDELAL